MVEENPCLPPSTDSSGALHGKTPGVWRGGVVDCTPKAKPRAMEFDRPGPDKRGDRFLHSDVKPVKFALTRPRAGNILLDAVLGPPSPAAVRRWIMKSANPILTCFSLTLMLTSLAASQTYSVTDLGSLDAGGVVDVSYANGINRFGHVVGSSYTALSPHAYLWTKPQGMQDLGTLGG